ncbi:protein of unknown function [Bradyrhizobium vignae]|uniref:Transposase IS4-like domain-containing protein n=1 Tax=Bradyrhizobium vignae TaxID=1549949 RepID=A0A2U3PV13_9BRAD|nr:protein of unknown function [Bradyrhizobium vignae]
MGRSRGGRPASPSACIIDSQSVKTSEAGGPRGYDAGKKVMGRKRHAIVDTDGRGLVLFAHPASVKDRDGAGPLLAVSRRLFPFIEKVFADAGIRDLGSRRRLASPSKSSDASPTRSASPSNRADGWCCRCHGPYPTHRPISMTFEDGLLVI